MRRILLSLALSLLLVPVPKAAPFFAAAFVQEATGSGNDVTITFGAAPSASNCVLVAAVINSTSQTVDLTGVPGGATETVLHGPSDHNSLRGYLYSFPGDGSDTTFVATSSTTGVTRVAAAEFSGLDCSGSGEDGTSVSLADNTSPYNLSPTITTSAAGSVIFGMVHGSAGQDYVVSGSTISIPSSGTEINTIALGGYYVAGAAAAGYDLPFTSTPNQNSLLMAVAVKASAVVADAPRSLLLLGVGGR